MSSRALEDLHPLFLPKARDFMDAAKLAGLDVLIYCTFRSRNEQDELYTHGRTKPGKIVTNAKAGQSAHNYGLAFDGVPIVLGKLAWDNHDDWAIYGRVAASVGLDWAGTWQGFKEMPHIQHSNWKSIAGI